MPNWDVTLRRTAGFLRTLFKSKMAIAGLIILIVYGFLAIAAPIVTPYDPQSTVVAGGYSPPSWYRYVNEGASLSQNVALETRTGFFADPTQNGWQLKAYNPSLTGSYDTSTSFVQGAGSFKITLDPSSGPGNFTATFKKLFDWPYNGVPARFLGSFAIDTPQATAQQAVQVMIFIERTTHDYRRWNLTDNTVVFNATSGQRNSSWGTYPLTTSGWHAARSLDSSSEALAALVGSAGTGPAQIIFSSKDTYSYGVDITISRAAQSTGPISVHLDGMNLQLLGTSWGFLGTDNVGEDIWSQLIYGARISLIVGLLSAFIGIVLGLVVGLVAGYLGKVVDEVLMRFTDMLLVIPGLPLLIVLISVLGDTLAAGRTLVLILVIGFLGWMGFARVVRAQVLSLKERPFVEAAKAAGAGTGHITVRHIIPNIVGLIYVNLALAVPGAILTEAALSFLGLGDVSVLSWGRMLNLVETNAAQRIWWWVLPPGISIALVSLAFVMIGFSLDTLFNPRLRQRR